jgi:hypothetical protein
VEGFRRELTTIVRFGQLASCNFATLAIAAGCGGPQQLPSNVGSTVYAAAVAPLPEQRESNGYSCTTKPCNYVANQGSESSILLVKLNQITAALGWSSV